MFTQEWSLHQHRNTAVQTPSRADINDWDKPYMSCVGENISWPFRASTGRILNSQLHSSISSKVLAQEFQWSQEACLGGITEILCANYSWIGLLWVVPFHFRLGKRCGNENKVTVKKKPPFINLNLFLSFYILLFAHPHFCLLSGPTFQISAHRQNMLSTAPPTAAFKVFTKAHKNSGQRLRRAKPISSC